MYIIMRKEEFDELVPISRSIEHLDLARRFFELLKNKEYCCVYEINEMKET